MVADKKIIEDINKMKDLRRKVLNDSASKKRVLEIKKDIKLTDAIIKYEDIIFYGSLILSALSFNIFDILFMFCITKLLFFGSKKLNKKSKETIDKLRESNNKILDYTEQFIENNETILDYRKGKKLTDIQRIKVNLCFFNDENYNYDLKKINSEYVGEPVNKNVCGIEIWNVEKLCDKINELYPGDEEIKIKTKALVYDKRVFDIF